MAASKDISAKSINPTDKTDLRRLYQRNVGMMAQLRLQPVTIRALWWGRYQLLEDWRIIPNVHYASWRLLWNDRPGGAVLFEGVEYPLGPDRVLAIPPRTPVSCRLDNPVMHLNLNFLLGHPYDNVPPQIPCAVLGEPMQVLVAELTEVDPAQGMLSPRQTLDLQLLIGLVLRNAEEVGPQPADERVRRILESLDDDPNLSNAELAKIAGMSTNGFHRLFREQVGIAPHAYVLGKKMDLACSLLQHTAYTVDAIAEECGFNDRAYFARAFRRQFGITPSQYRQCHSG